MLGGGPWGYRHGAGCGTQAGQAIGQRRAHGRGGGDPGAGLHQRNKGWHTVEAPYGSTATVAPMVLCQAASPTLSPPTGHLLFGVFCWQDLRLRHAAACHRGTCQLRHGRQRALQAAPRGGGGARQRHQEQHQGGAPHGRRGRSCRSTGCGCEGLGVNGGVVYGSVARAMLHLRRACSADV